MIDDSEKDINSLNNFEFKPSWENTREDNKPVQNKDKAKEPKRRSAKLPHKKRQDHYKISPYVKQRIIDAIKSRLKKDGITRSIDSISKEIISKSLYDVSIQSLDKKRKFLKLKNDDIYSFDKDQIVKELLYYKNLVKIDIIEKVKINKEFKNVLLCNTTNAIFPPTSHNLFHNAIDYHLIKNKIDENREKYIKSLSTSSEVEHIDKLHRNEINICVFYLHKDKKFSSMIAMTNEIKENKNQQFFVESDTAKIGIKEIFENDVFSQIRYYIKSNGKKIKKTIELNILRVLKKSKYHIITINKQKFISAYHPAGKCTNELNNRSKKIIDLLTIYKKDSIKSIITDSEILGISKLDIMKEIKWLIQIGLVRLYESGQIEFIKYDKS